MIARTCLGAEIVRVADTELVETAVSVLLAVLPKPVPGGEAAMLVVRIPLVQAVQITRAIIACRAGPQAQITIAFGAGKGEQNTLRLIVAIAAVDDTKIVLVVSPLGLGAGRIVFRGDRANCSRNVVAISHRFTLPGAAAHPLLLASGKVLAMSELSHIIDSAVGLVLSTSRAEGHTALIQVRVAVGLRVDPSTVVVVGAVQFIRNAAPGLAAHQAFLAVALRQAHLPDTSPVVQEDVAARERDQQ